LEDRVEAALASMVTGEAKILDSFASLEAVGHRVVHGGERFSEAVEITAEVEKEIEDLCELSPLHNPLQLNAIRVAKKLIGPPVKHLAVFDTAFHRGLPDAAKTYAGPFEWRERKIVRYGFHGSSFRYATNRITELLGPSTERRLIICHLGGGCSLAAVRGGKSIDTTMGFSPLDGIAMCTRSGNVDPAILIYLLRQKSDVDSLQTVLNKESGLAGLSGLPGDTRVIIPEAKRGNRRAQLALDVFIHRLRAGIGSMMAALGGCDVLVFTDVIGASEPPIRSAACLAFAFLGLQLDERKNREARGDSEISMVESAVRVFVIQPRESWQIGTEAFAQCL
jgi:acetate kinase